MSEDVLAQLTSSAQSHMANAKRALKRRLTEAGGIKDLPDAMETDVICDALLAACVESSLAAVINHLNQVQEQANKIGNN